MPILEPPVKVGEEYNVTIEAMASRTDGLTRVKGFLVFVKDAKPGENVKVRVTELRGRFALAERV